MELKKIIEISRQKIIDAHNAFYAGNPKFAKSCLIEAHNVLQAVSPEPDITEPADTGTPSAQDSLSFTEHMNRIEYLCSQTLVDVQKENYQKAAEDLFAIKSHITVAREQLRKFQRMKGGDALQDFSQLQD